MQYERIDASAGHEPTAEGTNSHADQAECRRCDEGKPPKKRGNWGWAVATGRHDWMDLHTPFAYHD